MKAMNSLCTWRPLVGVAVVGALAIAVSVQGSPRVGGERDKGSGKSQASRVVTGPSAHINSAIAGPAGASITLQPITALSGPGYVIAGQKATMGTLPARIWFEFHITGFPVTNTPPNVLKTFQSAVDAYGALGDPSALPPVAPGVPGTSGYDGDQAVCGGAINGVGSLVGDIEPSKQICASAADCDNAFIGAPCANGAGICTGGFCENAFENQCDPQWIFTNGAGGSKSGVYSCNNAPGNLNWGCGGTTLVDSWGVEANPSYGATLVLNVPANAKGLYTIGWDPVGTFLSDNDGAPITLAFVPGQVDVPCGSCCSDIGPGTTVCEDNMSATQCAGETPPTAFRAGVTCADEDCPACQRDTDCADGDLCTQDQCDEATGVCTNPKILTWTAGTCCEGGVVTTPNCPDQCEEAACSSPPDRGTAGCNALTGETCDDGSACTYNDTCEGGAGSCDGTSVIQQICTCTDAADCESDSECLLGGAQFPCSDGFCFCTETPLLSVIINPDGKSIPGYPIFDPNCFESGDSGDKVTGQVVVGAFGGDITGGQFQVTYDPTCVEFVSISAGPGLDVVYPATETTLGTIFMAVGVPFASGVSSIPGGGAVLASFSFIKIGECNSCQICMDGSNPQNIYLADAVGQRISVQPECSKPIKANNTVDLTVPGNVNTNSDCNVPTAVETWDAPSATDSCGTATVICRGEHEDGTNLDDLANGGGEFEVGASSFCCYAVSDYCGKVVGCPPDTNCADADDNGKSDGCWTVRVSDEVSLDITIGLGPAAAANRPGDGGLTRCIKFTLYADCFSDPQVFSQNVTFGGAHEFVGKSTSKIKIPGGNNWGCIAAQDQLHTLRSCYTFDGSDCIGGQLNASFYGDPRLGGNWLIGGNLDGWKKDDPTADPSLDVIDILDYGTFVSQYLTDYCDDPIGHPTCPNTPCGTAGPNADINGDGIVDMDDYAFVSQNFLVSSKECCCGPQTAGVNAITEISVAQLRALGLNDLVVADLNGDGLLNLADMAAFDQGVRPTKSTPTKGGTRSSGSR